MASPYLEQFKSRQIEVLLLTEEIDEFVAMHLSEYKNKKILSVDSGDSDSIKKVRETNSLSVLKVRRID